MNENEVLYATAKEFARIHNTSFNYAFNLIKSVISDFNITAQNVDESATN